MSLMKYAVYAGVIIGIAFFFEQIMVFMYDLTLQCAAGQLTSYVLLVVIWIVLYIVARAFFDKKVHPQSSKFALWASILHVGASLAVFLYSFEPLLLLIFPVIIVVGYWSRQKASKHPQASRIHFRFQVTHPEFIDGRGGACAVRAGPQGFTLIKFLNVALPLPTKELLIYLYRQQVEWTFEAHHNAHGLAYCIGVLANDRNYDAAFERCVHQANQLRQFLKRRKVRITDVSDVLGVQKTFYRPYFIEGPFALDARGDPRDFPRIKNQADEIAIEEDFSEKTFAIHALSPTFKPTPLYESLNALGEECYLQLHARPLSEEEMSERDARLTEAYRESIHHLSDGLEGNAEIQAASYLFTQTGQSKESIEPLLDKEELARLKDIKRERRSLEAGRKDGMWEFELYLFGNPTLVQTLEVKVGGKIQPLTPHALSPLAMRALLGIGQVVDSKRIFHLFPRRRNVLSR